LAKIQRKNSSGPCAEFQVVDFDVEDDDVDIENEMLDTSIAHVGGGLEAEDAVSALSVAGCVNVVEEDME